MGGTPAPAATSAVQPAASPFTRPSAFPASSEHVAVRALLEGNRATQDEIDNSLHWAASHSNVEAVRLLLQSGRATEHGVDASLKAASEQGHTEAVNLLLEYASQAGVHGLLGSAAYNGELDTMRALLEKPSDEAHAHGEAGGHSAALGSGEWPALPAVGHRRDAMGSGSLVVPLIEPPQPPLQTKAVTLDYDRPAKKPPKDWPPNVTPEAIMAQELDPKQPWIRAMEREEEPLLPESPGAATVRRRRRSKSAPMEAPPLRRGPTEAFLAQQFWLRDMELEADSDSDGEGGDSNRCRTAPALRKQLPHPPAPAAEPPAIEVNACTAPSKLRKQGSASSMKASPSSISRFSVDDLQALPSVFHLNLSGKVDLSGVSGIFADDAKPGEAAPMAADASSRSSPASNASPASRSSWPSKRSGVLPLTAEPGDSGRPNHELLRERQRELRQRARATADHGASPSASPEAAAPAQRAPPRPAALDHIACASTAVAGASDSGRQLPEDPELPGWRIEEHENAGRTWQTYHGPDGQWARSRDTALRMAAGSAPARRQKAPLFRNRSLKFTRSKSPLASIPGSPTGEQGGSGAPQLRRSQSSAGGVAPRAPLLRALTRGRSTLTASSAPDSPSDERSKLQRSRSLRGETGGGLFGRSKSTSGDRRSFASFRRSGKTVRSQLDPIQLSASPAPPPQAPEATQHSLDGSGIAVGDFLLARGVAPTGETAWFRAEVLKLRPTCADEEDFPTTSTIAVKFLATEAGDTQELSLPKPRVAYVQHPNDTKSADGFGLWGNRLLL